MPTGRGLGVGDHILFDTRDRNGSKETLSGVLGVIEGQDSGRVYFSVKADTSPDFGLVVPIEWARTGWWGQRLWSWLRKVLGRSQVQIVDEEVGDVQEGTTSEKEDETINEGEAYEEGQGDVNTATSAKVAVDN